MSISLEPVSRLSRDIVKGLALSEREARFLVDSYYQMQEYRKASANQARSMADEPHEVLAWWEAQCELLEKQVERALDHYSMSTEPGRWMRSVKGIGPVLAANFLAHLDVSRTETAGGFWRFAGLDPTQTWSKGERRPWNAALKVACWKASDSWVKLKGHADSYYSQVYVARKEYEIARNERGECAEQAAHYLATKRFGKDTEAAKAYAVGKLPAGQIDARARRYAVKLFLAHLHHVMYEDANGKPPPKPYVIEHLGHAHYLAPPNWPMQ